MNRIRRKSANLGRGSALIATIAAVVAGCSSDDGYDYYDAYGYAYGYPYNYNYTSALGYSDMYYADYGYGYPSGYAFYSYGLPGADELSIPKAASGSGLPGDVLRKLAAGESICPGAATVTRDRPEDPCTAAAGQPVQASTSVSLTDCQLPSGGHLSGTIQVDATVVMSDAECSDATVIDVSYTSTTTDLVYTAPDGTRIAVPELTRTGAYSRALGGTPTTLEITTEGRIERFDKAGAAVSSSSVTGNQTLTYLGTDAGFGSDGTLTVQDDIAGTSVSVSGAGVTRVESCCYPTAGSISVVRTASDRDTWDFGPNCGDVSLNGKRGQLDACF